MKYFNNIEKFFPNPGTNTALIFLRSCVYNKKFVTNLLDRDKEVRVMTRVAVADENLFEQKSDLAIRDQLIRQHFGLARAIASKFRSLGEPIEDLEQEAVVGLIHAIDRFDITRGAKFSTFAIPTILGTLKRYFRDKCWVLKVPRRLQELEQQTIQAEEVLSQVLGRFPTVLEIADYLKVDEEQALKAIVIRSAFRPDSLDRIVYEENAVTIGDLLGRDDPGMEEYEGRDSDLVITFFEAMDRLDEIRRKILHCRIWLGMTQDETAREIGCSQMNVSRLERSAKLKIRRLL